MLTQRLAEAGFDAEAPSIFLIEGVLDFLEQAAEPFLHEAGLRKKDKKGTPGLFLRSHDLPRRARWL